MKKSERNRKERNGTEHVPLFCSTFVADFENAYSEADRWRLSKKKADKKKEAKKN